MTAMLLSKIIDAYMRDSACCGAAAAASVATLQTWDGAVLTPLTPSDTQFARPRVFLFVKNLEQTKRSFLLAPCGKCSR